MIHSASTTFLRVPLALALMIFIAGAVARASSTTAPSTQPAGETPKAGLHAYNAAMAAQDMDAMLARTHATTEEQRRVGKAMSRSDMHVARLLQAAREKFGDAAAARLGQAIGDASDATIDAATESITDDHAKLRFDSGGGTALIRVDGKWKIDVAAVLTEANASPDELIESVSRHGNRAKVVAQEVAAGQFKSIDAVIDRLNKADEPTTKD